VWIRAFDQTGAALPRPWVIGAAPEVNEQEPNDMAEGAQLVPCSDAPLRTIVVNGRLQQPGDAEVFAVDVTKGQTLVADLDANVTIASGFDGVLQILRPDGFVAAHNDDRHGLDPQLAVETDSGGRWMVRVYGFPSTPTDQVQLAGDAAYVYRLTISTGPVVHYALPMAARCDHCNRYEIHGWNLTEELRSVSLRPTPDQAAAPISEHLFGITLRLPLLDYPTLVESEPNDKSEPNSLEAPSSMSGRIGSAGDQDAFQFDGVKDETVEIELQSRDLGYPLDGVLELFDAVGERVARVDDNDSLIDPRLAYTAKDDGPLRVVVSDLHGRGGLDFVYRMAITRATPSFSLTTESHQVIVKAGETTEIAINVERKLGFDETFEFLVDGLPQDVVASTTDSKPGDQSAAKVVISLSAAAGVAPTSAPLVIVGKSQSADSQPVRFSAPGHRTGLPDVWLTVTK
jgi:hypothetical protein